MINVDNTAIYRKKEISITGGLKKKKFLNKNCIGKLESFRIFMA